MSTGSPQVTWLVIRNPNAGLSRRKRRSWTRIERALDQAGLRFEVVVTAGPGGGAALAADAVAAGRSHILAAGGDGSVHEVVNGIFRARHAWPGPLPPTLGVLPLGTGNDWARSLGLPRAPGMMAAMIKRGRVVRHDVGRIDFPGQPASAGCWFVNVAGAGFDAHVIARLPGATPSRLAYVAGAVRALADFRAPSFRLGDLDPPATAWGGRFLATLVANGRYCGHGMHVAPQARPDDGLLDVVTVDAAERGTVLRKLPKLYLGTLLGDPLVRHAQTRSLSLEADPAAPVEADGQLVGWTPARFSVLPGALRVLVP